MEPLPLIAAPAAPVERADAARNRERILCSAARLFSERGAEHVSMDDVAEDAGVGKGTLYRRFGDKAGLAMALLDEDDRRFQDALIRGEAPLGPGAPSRERLHAFGEAYLDLLDRHSGLLAIAQEGNGLRTSAPWALYRTHLVVLLSEAAPDADAELGAELLLDSLSPVSYRVRIAQGFTPQRLKGGWRMLVDGWLAVSRGEAEGAPASARATAE
ncbi:MAG: TetR/AcrR family transcriptional regulator [Solirubrobacteraceae bacterium]|nr:TetR/AcrR family transcriptional regulator [Solirubrobacteraceae bacterium]